MNHDNYEDILISPDFLSYTFVSKGVNGDLKKEVEFSPFKNDERIYNLALSTMDDGGGKDFNTESRNGDRNKVLATIGRTIYIFSDHNPDKSIYLEGNRPSKTRLYRMAINTVYEEVCEKFTVFGITKFGNTFIPVPFVKDTNYSAFLFTRKAEVID